MINTSMNWLYLVYVVCVSFFLLSCIIVCYFHSRLCLCQWHCPLPVISNKYERNEVTVACEDEINKLLKIV